MREGIHPKWYPEARVMCACGKTWTVGAAIPELRTKRLEKRQGTAVDATKKKKIRKDRQSIVELVDEDAVPA